MDREHSLGVTLSHMCAGKYRPLAGLGEPQGEKGEWKVIEELKEVVLVK